MLKSKQKTPTLKSTTPAYRKAPYKTRAEAVSIQQWFEDLRYQKEIQNLAFRQMVTDVEKLEEKRFKHHFWFGVACLSLIAVTFIVGAIIIGARAS